MRGIWTFKYPSPLLESRNIISDQTTDEKLMSPAKSEINKSATEEIILKCNLKENITLPKTVRLAKSRENNIDETKKKHRKRSFLKPVPAKGEVSDSNVDSTDHSGCKSTIAPNQSVDEEIKDVNRAKVKEKINRHEIKIQNVSMSDQTQPLPENCYKQSSKRKAKDFNTETPRVEANSDLDDVNDADDVEIDCHEFVMKIDNKVWETRKPDMSKKWPALTGRWTEIFAKKFAETNPSCVLTFKYNRIKKNNSRKEGSKYFTGKAFCTHEQNGDPYVFTIRRKPKDGKSTIKVRVKKSSRCRHKAAVIKKRHLKGIRRDEMGNRAKHEGSSNLHYSILADMDPEAIDNGSFTECVTKKVLTQVLYEIRQKEKFAKEDIADALLTKNAYEEMDDDSTTIKGYVQSIGADPFTVICFTEAQIEILNSLKKQDLCVVHLDSTGKVVRKIQNQNKRPYYYAACVSNPIKGKHPIPIAEMISTDHTTVSIATFLLKLRHSSSLRFGKPIIPNRIECDFSWALINSALTAFCGQNIKQYLQTTWNYLHNNSESNKSDLCVIHLCCCHIIKRFRDKISALTIDKNLSQFVTYCFGLLQNETSLSSARTTYIHIHSVLTSKCTSESVNRRVDYLNKQIENMNQKLSKETEEYEECEDVELETDQFISNETIKQSSPYTRYFIDVDDKTTSSSGPLNKYYQKDATDVINSYIPIFPLWSGVLIYKTESITRDSNADVENWFKIVKHDILQGKKRLSPGNFVRKVFKVVKGRTREFLKTSKQCKTRSKKVIKETKTNVELIDEVWKRRHDSTTRSFYISPEKVPVPSTARCQPPRNNGLVNNNNQCWLNSTLQALKVCSSILTVSCSPEDSKLVTTVINKLKQLNMIRKTKLVHDVEDIMDTFKNDENLRSLKRGSQHDPCIFITTFLFGLQEFLPTELRYVNQCNRCKKRRASGQEDAFMLSLEMVPSGLNPSTQDLLNEFFKPETLTGEDSPFRPHCTQNTPHERSVKAAVCPNTLILQVKRFDNNMNKLKNTFLLDREISMENTRYELKAIQIHEGDFIGFGHYHTLTLESNCLVDNDDTMINVLPMNDINSSNVQSNAYILYYEKTGQESQIIHELRSQIETADETLVLYRIGKYELRRKDVMALFSKNWLSDQVVNSSFDKLCLCSDVAFFDSFFLPTAMKHGIDTMQWIPDVSSKRLLFFPVYTPGHWSLVVVKPQKKKIAYLDPMGNTNTPSFKMIQDYMIRHELKLTRDTALEKEVPQQEEAGDYGVFVIMYCKCLVERQPMNIIKGKKKLREEIVLLLLK